MSDKNLAIETRGLRKIYYSGFFRRPFTGLAGLDLKVRRGEIFGFIGPNGAGKTTTIKCLVDLHHPTGGQAWLLGLPIDRPEARRRVGFLPERPFFYQHLTAAEFLDFYGQLFDIPKPERMKRIAELLERVGLERFADSPLRNYSKGMLQRAGVAQALINQPELIILDEPMSGLDPLGRMLIRDIVLEEKRRGGTVFFSSHILSDVQSICDRVGLLDHGQLQAVGGISELLSGQVEHLECTVRAAEDLDLAGEEVARQGQERVIRLDPAELDAFLAALLAAEGQVLQVQPARRTLEDLLVEQIRSGRETKTGGA